MIKTNTLIKFIFLSIQCILIVGCDSRAKLEAKAKIEADKKGEMAANAKMDNAYRELKSLLSIIGETSIDDFENNYLSSKRKVIELIDDLPESKLKLEIFSVLDSFSDIKVFWNKSINNILFEYEKLYIQLDFEINSSAARGALDALTRAQMTSDRDIALIKLKASLLEAQSLKLSEMGSAIDLKLKKIAESIKKQ